MTGDYLAIETSVQAIRTDVAACVRRENPSFPVGPVTRVTASKGRSLIGKMETKRRWKNLFDSRAMF